MTVQAMTDVVLSRLSEAGPEGGEARAAMGTRY